MKTKETELDNWSVQVPIGDAQLEGDLTIPAGARGLVLFAHGSGSSRMSPRNRFVAEALNGGGLATLLIDLLTEREERIDVVSGELRFDIELLAGRLIECVDWLRKDERTRELKIGTFGSSTGAAAALIAAARRRDAVGAVVSRGGRPDLAGAELGDVFAPTLLIVGGRDEDVLELNREALILLRHDKRLEIVPGATHLFEETGALDAVARLARDWFVSYLTPAELRLPGGEPVVPGP